MPTFTQTVADGTYSYTVRAQDAAGNWSAQSTPVGITIDTTPPSVPVLTSLTATGNSVTLTWSSSIGSPTQYEVFRNSVSQGATSNTFLTQTVVDGTYSYTVRAQDAAGNWSAQSSSMSITVDTTPPAQPAQPNVMLAASPSRTLTVSWLSVVSAVLYEVFLDSVSKGTTSGTSLQITDVQDGSHNIAVRAKDNAGNWSTASPIKTVTVNRTPPPAPSTTVNIAQHNLDTKDVYLSWPSVPGAVSYGIYRDGTKMGSTSSTSLQDTVPSDGSYSYAFSVIDSDDNESAPSNAVNVTVASDPRLRGLHVPPAIKTFTVDQLDYTVDQRKFPDEDNIRFDRD